MMRRRSSGFSMSFGPAGSLSSVCMTPWLRWPTGKWTSWSKCYVTMDQAEEDGDALLQARAPEGESNGARPHLR